MDVKSILAPDLDKLKEELFTSLIDETMQELPEPPPGSLEPKIVWEKKTRRELMEFFSGQSSLDKTARGFEALIEDLSSHLSPLEMEKISEEWERGVQVWIDKNSEDSSEMSQSLQQMMGISEKTFTHFYQAACRYFEQKNFQKAADAFYVIASLDPNRYNVWLSQGLSEARTAQFELALVSFSMASILKIEEPLPYIYAADVCIQDHRIDEAKEYIHLAKEAIDKGARSESKQFLQDSLKQLQKLAK